MAEIYTKQPINVGNWVYIANATSESVVSATAMHLTVTI